MSALWGATAAFAGNAELQITVAALPDTVSLTRPSAFKTQASTAYAAYQVDVRNNSGNTLNAVVFSSIAATSNGTAATFTEFVSTSPGDTCAGAGIQVSCSFGQMKSGDATTILLVFKTPTSGDFLTFTTTASYSTAGSASSTPSSVSYLPLPQGTVVTALVDPATNVSVNTRALTYVPTTGTAVCTGVDCIPTGANPGTVTLSLPSKPTGGIASLGFGPAPGTALCSGYPCNSATVTAPGLFTDALAPFTVTLRRSGVFVLKGAKIQDSPVFYTFDDGTRVDITTNYCRKDAAGNSLPPLPGENPAAVSPCIAALKAYPKNYRPNPALADVFEWVIYSLHNGRFDM